jgi:hypothetical protein
MLDYSLIFLGGMHGGYNSGDVKFERKNSMETSKKIFKFHRQQNSP